MRRISWLVVAGDIVMLILFVVGGQVSHESSDPDAPVLGILKAALPFALVWFPTAYFTRALTYSQTTDWRAWLLQTVAAWLITAPLGIVVRSWLINRAVIPLVFLEVTHIIGLAFFAGWRLVLILISRFLRRQTPVSNL